MALLALAPLALALAAPPDPPSPSPTSSPRPGVERPPPAPPPSVLALLAPGRMLAHARQVDLDGDGLSEWVLVVRYDHPDRLDFGPRSAEWRGGLRVESRATHELLVVGGPPARPELRVALELRGNELQPVLVEPLADAAGRRGRLPVLVVGARACVGSCGPVEVHLVAWDPEARALRDLVFAGAEFAVLTPAGLLDLWWADRRTGDAMCCPSGYTVQRLGLVEGAVDTVDQRSVPATQMRRVLPPGGLIFRGEP